MASNINIINTFEGGMNQDALPYLQPKGTYRHAINMVKGDRYHLGYGLSTEESDKKVAEVGEVVGAYYVESIDSTVLFVLPGSIYLFKHSTEEVEFIASDSEFGCNWNFNECEYISATFKTIQPCNELNVYFSSGCEFFAINLTELQNPVRKQNLIDTIKNKSSSTNTCEITCDYFKIFKCLITPKITAITTNRGGHRVVSGTYQFVIQLEDNGGNTTNWYNVGNPISVESENNQPGELSLSSIKVHITNLDCRYDKVNIAVFKTVDGVHTGEVVATRHYSTDGITFTYVGQQGRAISMVEIQSKRKLHLKGKDVSQKDNRLFLYNIKQEKNINMQKRVLEEAKLSFIEMEVTPQMAGRHGMRTLLRGENYLFGVVYNYCDGTHSSAFLLKPNGFSDCTGGYVFSSEMSEASGDGQKYLRPRGGYFGEGAAAGCATGSCAEGSGGGNYGLTSPPASTSNESDIVSSWDTTIGNIVEAAKCDDCVEPWCCAEDGDGVTSCSDCGKGNCEGCEQDEIAYNNDLPKAQDLYTTHTDFISSGNQDGIVDYNSGSLIEAAKNLIDSVDNSEFHKIKASDYDINVSVGETLNSGDGGLNINILTINTLNPTKGGGEISSDAIFSDEYTNGKGEYLLENTPKVVNCFAPKVVYTSEKYPDSKDCNGEYLYGDLANTNVQLFRTPSNEDSRIVDAKAFGVPSPDTSTDPLDAVTVKLLGVRVQIPEPDELDLPKPLSPNNPWSLVIIPRDEINSTVQAKGIGFGTMVAETAGDTLIFGRHGCNSRVNVERWAGSFKNRFTDIEGKGMFFYGLDTEIGRVGLSGRTFRQEAEVQGLGYRYSLYEEGMKPEQPLTGRRVDQRGATQAINLNNVIANNKEHEIKAVGYLGANLGAQVIQGASHKVCTLNRESSVYIETDISFRTDYSFTTDTLDHSCPINMSYGIYGAVVREIEDQYGSVQGMTFISSGIEGRGFGVHQGVVGDSFISPYTFVRQSYVSDKVGNTYPTPERDRTVCDSPNDKILQEMGIDYHATRLPTSGDRSDAKNWAGGYEDDTWNVAFGKDPRTDYYYPKVQKTLITTWVESKINGYYRATGYGLAKETLEVYYPKLKGLSLAASLSKTKTPWEKSFLNLMMHYRVEQPSVSQLTRKAIVKNIIYILLPLLGLDKLSDITGVVDGVGTVAVFPLMYAYWYAMKNLLTRGDYLDKLLGLPICKTDEAGGENDNSIDNFHNNYYGYNYDHSALNYANYYQSMPADYNTCSCDDCDDKSTTDEIFYSNKQVQGSMIDFYRQFGALSFVDISHDLGKLRKLFTVNGKFFAQTEDFIVPLLMKETNLNNTTTGDVMMGGSLSFSDTTAGLFEGVVEGILGNIDPNAGIVTPLGYVFIDRESRTVYVFDGSSSPQSVSSLGMNKFFNEYIDFCEVSDCHDEKSEKGTYYSLGYDPKFKRILITKKENKEEGSFTISLDISDKNPAWVSFHTYIPKLYFNDRHNIYNIRNGCIYRQNAGDGTYRKFNNELKESEIEFVAVSSDTEAFRYQDTFINTEAEKGDVKNLDKTFNKIAVYNTTQGTGTLNTIVLGDNKDSINNMSIKIEETGKLKLHKIRRAFRFNGIKDNTKEGCLEKPMTIKEDCTYLSVINDGIYECSPPNKQNFRNTVISDDHLVYRMSFNEDEKILLKLLTVRTNGDKEIQ